MISRLFHAGAVYARMEREEAVPVPEEYKDRVYYHGTSNEEVAKKILQEGKLRPGKDWSDQSDEAGMDPMLGQVYFTPSLDYVQHYVVGCHANCEPEYLIKQGGRYGYLFVIPSSALEDVVPDEDALGRMMCKPQYGWLLKELEKLVDENEYEFNQIVERILERQYEIHAEDQKDAGEEVDSLQEYLEFAAYHYNFFDELSVCAYPEIAVAGKFFLEHADDELVLDVLESGDFGESLSHEGEVTFSEAWRFDKLRAPELHDDGSNFFELAERVA